MRKNQNKVLYFDIEYGNIIVNQGFTVHLLFEN